MKMWAEMFGPAETIGPSRIDSSCRTNSVLCLEEITAELTWRECVRWNTQTPN